ncbi:Stage V sporulation protein T [compost metagenome]
MLLENSMDSRKIIVEANTGTYELIKDHAETISTFVIAPIIAGGDPIGSVTLVNKDESVKMSQLESKMAETAAGFLGKQMEQ